MNDALDDERRGALNTTLRIPLGDVRATRKRPIFCLTAGEAYPILERWFLEAESEIVASYRIFDPSTRLHSPEAREIGKDWFDLLVHTLRRGVDIIIYVSDFDPIAAHELHRTTWCSVQMLLAAAEAAGPGSGKLRVVAAAHPSCVGPLPRIILLPAIAKRLWQRCRELNRMSPVERQGALRNMPGLAQYLTVRDAGVRPRLTLPQLLPGTHHQKVAAFDRKRLTLGGLDLNDRRWDTQRHEQPAEETWHDVQVFLEDASRAEAATRHILTLQRTTGGMTPSTATPGLIRTMSRRRKRNIARLSPKTIVNEISRAHRYRIAEARRFIYLETQFFRDLRTATRLAHAGRENAELELLLVLPAAPEDVAFDGNRSADARLGEFLQSRCIRILRRGFGSRVLIVAPAQPRRTDDTGRSTLWGAPIVYVHAKVSIFDDRAAIVSSANLNGRSLYWDTELGTEFTEREDVEALRRRCFAHWLPDKSGPHFFSPQTALASWRRLAVENLRRDPERRNGFVLPYDPTPGDRFGRDLPAVPNEMV